MKLKKIPQNGNLTNERVRAYNDSMQVLSGDLETTTDKSEGVVCRHDDGLFITNVKYYIKLSDIDKEARKQIKEMKSLEGGKGK